VRRTNPRTPIFLCESRTPNPAPRESAETPLASAIQDDQSRGARRQFLILDILDFRFWIEERGDHSGFFNPKSKIQNEFGCVTTCVVMYN
ncbi:MAG: hypothetical protein ACLQOO_25270, partial [Terriglobia bacterium]